MAFFDKLASSISGAGSTIQKKAKDYTSAIHIDTEISSTKKACNKLLLDLGERYYEVCMGITHDADLSGLVKDITEQKKKLEALNKEKQRGKGMRVCPVCRNEIDPDSKFCQFCGTNLTPPPRAAAPVPEVEEDESTPVSSPDAEDPASPLDAEFVPYSDPGAEAEDPGPDLDGEEEPGPLYYEEIPVEDRLDDKE